MRAAMVVRGGVVLRCTLLLGLVGLLVVLRPVTAVAEPPVALDGQLTDSAGVVSDAGAAREAQASLLADADIQLWAAFVRTFDGMSSQQWAAETARRNGLGVNDVLLAVAVDDRQYEWWVDDAFPLSDDELRDVAVSQIEPQLADGDWAGAVVAAAEGYARAVGGGGGAGLGGVPLWLWAPPLLALGGWLLWRRSTSTSRSPSVPPPPADVPLSELRSRADALLVATDDAVSASREELGFAEAQFGAEATASFHSDLATAEAELREAFRMRQEANAADDDAARRRLLRGAIERAEAADARLDARVEEFERLRALEHRADEVVAELQAAAQQVAERVPAARDRLAELSARYADAVVAPVGENAEQASSRVDAARAALDEARDALVAEDRSAAVMSARVAETAIAQARQLLAAVERLDADLATVDTRLGELMAETERDLAEAQHAGGALARRLAPVVRDAELALAEAQAQRSSSRPDPLHALHRLSDADEALEALLVEMREAADRAARARRQLAAALDAAAAEIQGVDEYIRTRRGAVGPDARTQLAAARRRLDEAHALREDDPEAALRAAQDADRLADDAGRLARSDRDEWGSWGGGGRRGGVDLGSLVLGGILLGGGRGGGGGGFGGGIGGGGGRGGGGGFGGGGFGGGFGGGGGRGGGGRF